MGEVVPINQHNEWSWEENMQFEECLASDHFNTIEDESTRWQAISDHLGGRKTPKEVEIQYQKLVCDIENIENGEFDHQFTDLNNSVDSYIVPTPPTITQWSDDEHKMFLVGLEIYDKGDWKSISRNMVKTRNPTQVASHAQKYYIRKGTENKGKRGSIHDTSKVTDELVNELIQKGLITPDILNDLNKARTNRLHKQYEYTSTSLNQLQVPVAGVPEVPQQLQTRVHEQLQARMEEPEQIQAPVTVPEVFEQFQGPEIGPEVFYDATLNQFQTTMTVPKVYYYDEQVNNINVTYNELQTLMAPEVVYHEQVNQYSP
ncbi:transcription factor DIVARICATA-like [Spinacia oleracea]|uniref:Transcription factor DIVARICATA-like n=1 Tax=Spinacia oleracea TaxID=3562 RepID=A0ABM3R0P3_SPIOL|nr:transcription factor DIVARICATA-like [Spinacia oleracea]